jgi:hypothetical protein
MIERTVLGGGSQSITLEPGRYDVRADLMRNQSAVLPNVDICQTPRITLSGDRLSAN